MSDSSSKDHAEILRAAAKAVADELDADIILYSGGIYPPGDTTLIRQVKTFRKRENVLFHLTTGGGSPNVAFRIARCLQRAYADGKIILFVDSECKSAGSLIALGADEIVMSVMAELGPLDVQMSKPDALAEQTSGLTPTHAIQTLTKRAFESLEDVFLKLRFRSGLQITTKTALEVATNLTTGLFCPIFEQIDPMRLGEISRAMLIAQEYGGRLTRGNEKAGTLDTLIEGYPSHGFVIDRDEAKELFSSVREPTGAEALLAKLLEPFVDEGLDDEGEPLVQFVSALIRDDENTTTEGDIDDRSIRNRQRGVHSESGGDGKPTDEESGEGEPATRRRRRARSARPKKKE